MRFSIVRQLPGMVSVALLLAALSAAPAGAQTPSRQPAQPGQATQGNAGGQPAQANPAATKPAATKPAADPAAAQAAEALATMYRVPDTSNVDELLEFVDKLRRYEPRDIQSYTIHRKQMPRAVKAAAEKVMALEKNKNSDKYIMASDLVLRAQLTMLDEMPAAEMKALVDSLKQRLSVTQPPDQDYEFAFRLAASLERTPYIALAADAYGSFAKPFIASGKPQIVEAGKQFEAAARRLSLIGRPLEVFGNMMDGKPINWKSYAGKVVLVDFWFTDCPPCRAEIPNVKRLYKLYHDRGFEVVGISVDDSHLKLETFLHDEQIPWTNVFDTQGEEKHPLAEYYGVITYPSLMLVGKDGKVITFDARGERLEEWLTKLLGPSGEKPAEPKNAKGPAKRPS